MHRKRDKLVGLLILLLSIVAALLILRAEAATVQSPVTAAQSKEGRDGGAGSDERSRTTKAEAAQSDPGSDEAARATARVAPTEEIKTGHEPSGAGKDPTQTSEAFAEEEAEPASEKTPTQTSEAFAEERGGGSERKGNPTRPSDSGRGGKRSDCEAGGVSPTGGTEQSRAGSDDPLPQEHMEALRGVCEEAGVDLSLALGLIQTESSFDPYAVSETGCYGYCQLSGYFPSGLSPEDNLRAGIGWLGELIAQHGDVGRALTIYHLGHDDGTRIYAGVVLGYARAWGYTGGGA